MGLRFLFQMHEADNYIRNLHSGVVDVVLHVDVPARLAQQANKSIAEDGITQVPDVRGLVGIDGGVFDQDFQFISVSLWFLFQ